jgi:hypothetical protein
MATVSRVEVESKRAEIIKLRCQGHTLDDVARMVGLAGPSSVKYHEDAWLAEQKPSSEQTEERRQKQLASVEEVRVRLFAMLSSEPETSDRLAVVDRIEKLWNREARLMGLDLQAQSGVTLNVTAEALAQVFGFDAQAVDVQAEEITDGSA